MRNKTAFNDYQTAINFIEQGRSGYDRPVANNTRLHRDKGIVGLKLHATDVVNLYENGDVEFNSGGWRTVTTADRIRYNGDYDLYSDGGIWFICHRASRDASVRRLRKKFGLPLTWSYGSGDWESEHLGYVGPRSAGGGFWGEVAEVIGNKDAYRIYREFEKQVNGKGYLFFDGIKFTARGKCLNGIPVEQARDKVNASNRLRRRIRAYAQSAIQHLHEGVATGSPEPWNEITEFDYTYCERIMDEGEFPVRLYFDAMRESGYNDTGMMIHLGERYDEEIGVRMIGGTRPGYRGGRREAANLDIVANAIYKFIGKRMLPERQIRNAFGGMSPSAMEGVK